MSNITKTLPSTPITEDLLMRMVLDHEHAAPTLDYAVLIEIRKIGYINSGELARKLNDLGFTQLEITQRSVDLMYDLKERPESRRKPRKIVGCLIDFKRESRELTRSFASYTGYAWGSGRRIGKTPAPKTMELPFDNSKPLKMLSEREIVRVKAEFDKYRSWSNKIDWEAAQQHFMDKCGHALGFEVKSEDAIVDWIVKALRTGKLPASPKKIAKVVNYELKWLRENPRSMRKQFNMEYTPSNIALAVRRKTKKSIKELALKNLIGSVGTEEHKPILSQTDQYVDVRIDEISRANNLFTEACNPATASMLQPRSKTTEPPVKKIGKLKAFTIREFAAKETNSTNTMPYPSTYFRATIEVDLEIATLEALEIVGQITR